MPWGVVENADSLVASQEAGDVLVFQVSPVIYTLDRQPK